MLYNVRAQIRSDQNSGDVFLWKGSVPVFAEDQNRAIEVATRIVKNRNEYASGSIIEILFVHLEDI